MNNCHMKKRILFLIPTLMNGGAERVLLNLVNNTNYDQFDISVKTVMNVGRYQSQLDERIHYSYIFNSLHKGTRFFFNFFSPEYLYNRYIGYNYDIVVSYLEGMTSRIVSGCQNQDVKKVTWIHIELNNKKLFTIGFRSFREAKKCYKSFDNIVCVSDTVRKCFEEVSGIHDNLQVLYNTNETDQIRKHMLEPVDDMEFNQDAFNICSVAKIEPSKGYDRLVRIHKKLLSDGIKNRVFVFGTGSEKDKLEAYLKENNLTGSFRFVGYRENPYKYIRLCDLYVCSSRREGFSTAVTEALIIGLPVISTNCSGAKELLGYNNEYGIVVDNDELALMNGIREMLSVEGLLDYYKQQAIKRGEFFSTEKTVAAVTNMLLS